MFSFFRRGKTAGKTQDGGEKRNQTNDRNSAPTSVRHEKTATSHLKQPDASEREHATLTRKDVVNLLIPPTDYNHSQKTGVSAILQSIMAGNRRRNRKKNRHKNPIARAESYKEISSTGSDEMQVNLYRSHSQLDKTFTNKDDTHEALSAPVSASDLTYDVIADSRNNFTNAPRAPATDDVDPASFVKELVLQKYKNKSPVQPKRQHVSLVYVSSEPQVAKVTETDREAEKQHAAELLREIAKKINCDLNDSGMGASDSKGEDERRKNERKFENEAKNDSITALKADLRNELDKLLQIETPTEEPESHQPIQESENIIIEGKPTENRTQIFVVEQPSDEQVFEEEEESASSDEEDENNTNGETKPNESPGLVKKSNLKPPRSDTEGCSDDDRSDCGKKKVTFRKTIDFDDGDQQTDDEVDSSFESLASSEEEVSEEEESADNEIPDNDELLGGVVVVRNDEKSIPQETSIEEPKNEFESDLKTSESHINRNTKDDQINCDSLLKIKDDQISCDSEINTKKELPEMDNQTKEIDSDKEDIQRINSDNSDSGFLEIAEKAEERRVTDSVTESESETEGSEVSDSEEIVTSEEEIIAEVVEPREDDNKLKNLVTQEDALSAQVAHLSELANSRCNEAERARQLLHTYRKEIETRDKEIERLKSELAAAYKESELIRQRSRSLEEEMVAARSCSADLAGKLSSYSHDVVGQLRCELEAAQTRVAELDSRAMALERDRARLEVERHTHEQKALEAVSAAEACSARWKAAHEAARSQAAARAERLLADCEWKMRELEKRARDAEKHKTELTAALKKAESNGSHQVELQQLRGLASEQQRSVQALSGQLQRLEAREDALKTEVHRLRELLEKEAQVQRDKDERHFQTITRLEVTHSKQVETIRSEMSATHAATRATLERAHAERTRAALAQLRAEQERDAKNHERKMREAHNKLENLKETLESKQMQFAEAMEEARSKADWELLQLRHLLDKADITYASNLEQCSEKHEKECERLNSEWSERLRETEDAAAVAEGAARALLNDTRSRLEVERLEQVNRLKEQHKQEMDLQWERFMRDKEECLARMKLECRQEGEEERTRREKDMVDEIADLKAQIEMKTNNYDDLNSKTAACERTLAVTEQELREALEREKQLREMRSEDAEKIKQAKAASRNEIEHLTRKCACLRKLFDDMRARLTAREKASAEESRVQQREIQQLKTEVARLTKILMEQSSPKLGARTRADGCDFKPDAESFFCEAGPQACETQPSAPRRKGGTLRTPELQRRRSNIPEPLRPLNLADLKPISQDAVGRRRAKSVDLPAVQVPVRIKQLEDRNK